MGSARKQQECLWTLRLISMACDRKATETGDKDWAQIAAAAHMCVHYLTEDCPIESCTGPDSRQFFLFVDSVT
jgi:hypothetical protein